MPGPNVYSSIDASYSAPKYGFGTSSREDYIKKLRASKEVGPGSYQSQSFIGQEGVKSSIGLKIALRHAEKESRNKPGPAQYEQVAIRTVLK